MTDTQNVSHSTVDAFNQCEMASYYSDGLAISPNRPSMHLQIGGCFHEMAEAYYKTWMKTSNYDLAVDAAVAINYDALANSRYFVENTERARLAFDRYVDDTDIFEWEVLEIENYFEYELEDGIVFNGLIDAVVRVKRAPAEHRKLIGKLAVVDHKTCYNFVTKEEKRMHTQLAKYIFVSNATKRYGNEKIEYGILNQVRWRADARQVVKRDLVEPSYSRQLNIMNDHLKTARRYVARNALPLNMQLEEATRTTIKHICKNCDFVGPCDLTLEGAPQREIQAEIETYFREKDFSYRENRKLKALANAS